MFERFTERARKVVVLAQEESGRLRHGYVGTEHLLLGLVREGEGVAAQALNACGVTTDGARDRIEGIVGYGEEDTSQKPFTPRSKKVLELALREAQDLRHDHIGTEHLLLGLLAEGRGIAAAALSSLGVDPERVRREVLGRLGGSRRSRGGEEVGPLGRAREALRKSFGRYPQPQDAVSFERFTERARKVVAIAQDEARRFNHNYIGTEHLLLGLLREEDGIAGRVLREVGVDLEEARGQVESIVGYGEDGTGARAPFTPRTSKVLQMAQMEAMQLDHDYIGTEHILLGLANEVEGVAARVLSNLEVDPDAIRREVVRLLPERVPGVDLETADLGPGEARSLFHGRVAGIKTELALPRSVAVEIEADYAYMAPVGPTGGSTTVAPGDVADVMRSELEEADVPVLEVVITALGGSLLDAFPDMLEVSVTVSGPPEPSDQAAPTFSVSATFRR